MIKGNKGEWSEFYAFLKILKDRQLPAAGNDLNIIDGKFFTFHKIIREENTKIYDLTRSDTEIFIIDNKGKSIDKFKISILNENIIKIFDRIRDGKGKSFIVPEAIDLMNKISCTQIKAGSMQKSDLTAVIDDRISQTSPELGFSIKSMIGGAPTLLNAGKTTNFIYEVINYEGNINKVNSIKTRSKIQDRISYIKKKGGSFRYTSMQNKQFAKNLKMVDTSMPIFMANMLLASFSGISKKLDALTKTLADSKELQSIFDLSLADYEFKIKNLLEASALGMVPATIWDGFTRAHGGYIVVRKDGVVVCYHLYNRDELRSYLFKNTKFETPSTSKFEFGELYEEKGKKFIKLSLQIRFLL